MEEKSCGRVVATHNTIHSCSYLKEKSTRKSIDLLQLADDGTGSVELWHSVAHRPWMEIDTGCSRES